MAQGLAAEILRISCGMTLTSDSKNAIAVQDLGVLTAWYQFIKNWWTGRELNP